MAGLKSGVFSSKWNYSLDLAHPAYFTWKDQIFDVAISCMLDPLEVSLLRDTEVGPSICKAPAHSNVFTTRNEPDFPYQLLLHKPSGNNINIKIMEDRLGLLLWKRPPHKTSISLQKLHDLIVEISCCPTCRSVWPHATHTNMYNVVFHSQYIKHY